MIIAYAGGSPPASFASLRLVVPGDAHGKSATWQPLRSDSRDGRHRAVNKDEDLVCHGGIPDLAAARTPHWPSHQSHLL